MNETDSVKIAQSWVAFHYEKQDSPANDENFWAYEAVSEISDTDPDECINIINQICSLDSGSLIIANLAAGPLEDLLVKHGDQVIAKIILIAESSGIWRKMLGAVWKNDIKDSVWKELKKISAKSW